MAESSFMRYLEHLSLHPLVVQPATLPFQRRLHTITRDFCCCQAAADADAAAAAQLLPIFGDEASIVWLDNNKVEFAMAGGKLCINIEHVSADWLECKSSLFLCVLCSSECVCEREAGQRRLPPYSMCIPEWIFFS